MRTLHPLNAALGVMIAGGTAQLGAQTQINLRDVTFCECSLEAVELLRIGTMDGEGTVDGDAPEVVFDEDGEELLLFDHGAFRIKRYGPDGGFLGAFGREGEGPGDLGWVTSATYRDDEILLLDYRRGGFVRVNEEGEELWFFRTVLTAGDFKLMEDGSVVVARLDQSPERVGLPLHHLSFADSSISSFGSEGAYSVLDPLGGAVLLGKNPGASTVWWGGLDQMHFEEWDVELQKEVRSVEGMPSWWDPELRDPGRGEARQVVVEFGIDGDGVLWSVTRVPDPDWDWREARGMEGIVTRDQYDDFWDTRIDALDLESGEHLGTVLWDEASTDVLAKGDEIVMGRLEYTNDFFPQYVIYRLAPSGSR